MKFTRTLLIAAGILLLPVNAPAIDRVIHAEWAYPYIGDVAGFRLYRENTLVCETTDPNATSMDCSLDAPDGETWFAVTTFFQDGTESPDSAPFSYIFASDLKAILTADPMTGDSPLTISFDATSSTGNIISYEWLFGDGETGTGDTVDHVFTSAGNYTVTLVITDDAGAVDREKVSIVVTSPSIVNAPPTAVISSSASVGDAPLQVQFDGTGSLDSDGTILSYKWDMGDGETATGPQVTYTYPSVGTFHAALTVTDDGGLTDTVSTPVIVSEPPAGSNIPPHAVITASTNKGKAPLSVTFDAGKSGDPDGEIRNYSWNFGDGASGTGVSVTHEFSQDAVYTVTLKVTDDKGASSQPASYTVTVRDGDEKKGDDQGRVPAKTIQALQVIYNLLLRSPEEKDSSAPKE